MSDSDIPLTTDVFGDVIEAERSAAEDLERRCDLLRTAIAMADGLIGMSGSEHYKHFVAALEDNYRARTAEMLSAKTDREAAVLAGRCRELRDVLTMATKTRINRERLVAALGTMEDQLRTLTNPEQRSFLT